jgi:hypothetical protein
LRTAANLRAVVNIEDVHDVAVLADPIDDAIGTAPRAVTAGEWPVPGLADTMRIDCPICDLARG